MKFINKIFCTNVCLTSRKSLMVLAILLISTLVLAGVLYESEDIETPVEQPIETPVEHSEEEMWVPTKEDIEYQDSMYQIIQNTQNDIEDIKEDIVLIIERLDYEDGTHDSIRYVKGGPIDKRRN